MILLLEMIVNILYTTYGLTGLVFTIYSPVCILLTYKYHLHLRLYFTSIYKQQNSHKY